MTLFSRLAKFPRHHRYVIYFICLMTLSALIYKFIIMNKTEKVLNRIFSGEIRELNGIDTGTISIQLTNTITISINVIHRKGKNGIR